MVQMTVDAAVPSEADAGADGSAEAAGPLGVTPEAMATVLGIRDAEDDADSLALRVEITGSKGREYVYDLSFAGPEEVATGHLRYTVGDLQVAVEEGSVDRLTGAELDLPRNPSQGGLVIRNPNTPDPFDGVEIELTGELPDRVTQLLDERINPMLASHGGFAQLVGVDGDDNVYVTMGGGCQGCAASAATLRDGIRTSIMEAIPEVTEVIDTTDHDAGENPFYS